MANEEPDGGVHDAVAGTGRAAVMVAMQVGQRLAKAWQDLARDVERRATAESALLAARFEAERATAVARLSVTERADWWEHATAQEILEVTETAATWRDLDPAAARAAERIDLEAHARYGVNRDALEQHVRARADRSTAVEAIAAADALDRTPANDRRSQHRDEETQASADQAAGTSGPAAGSSERERGEIAYDSAARREAFAAALDGTADSDLIAGRVRADINFAHPAEHDVTGRNAPALSRRQPPPTLDRPHQRPGRAR